MVEDDVSMIFENEDFGYTKTVIERPVADEDGKQEIPASNQEKLWGKTGIRIRVIEEIREHAGKNGIHKVILFGSRARGDYERASDIDLAVSGGDPDRFRLDVEEETDTLLQYDVVNLDLHLQSSLRDRIEKEGIVLYEKVR